MGAQDDGTVTITISGPANEWFAVGLNASRMADQPYALIVFPDGTVVERKLGTCGEEVS